MEAEASGAAGSEGASAGLEASSVPGAGVIAGPIGDGHGGQAHEADADAAFLPLQEKLEEASGECDSRYHQKKKGWI